MADRILIVEDDEDTLEVLAHIVRGEGFEVVQAKNGKQAMQIIKKRGADLVVLDRRLPDMDGLQVCEYARKICPVPIIILSALTSETDKVASLNVGADDYIDKPFQPGELTARIRAQLRRFRLGETTRGERELVRAGDLVLDPSSYEATIGEDPVRLTRLEFELLYMLARQAGQAVPREKLLEAVWGKTSYIYPEGLNVHIRRLRRKIEKDPDHPVRLLTVRTIGYKLVAPRTAVPD